MFLTCRTAQKGGLLGFVIMTSRDMQTRNYCHRNRPGQSLDHLNPIVNDSKQQSQ